MNKKYPTWETVEKRTSNRNSEELRQNDGNLRTIRMQTFVRTAICPNTREWDELIIRALISDINGGLFTTGARSIYVTRDITVTRDPGNSRTRASCYIGFIPRDLDGIGE